MIEEKQSPTHEANGSDLFTNLVAASQQEKASGQGLSVSELKGDIFIFLLAGASFHDRTSFEALTPHRP